MNWTPSSVLTMGLGAWGSQSLIVTLGYGISVAVVIQGGRLEYTAPKSIVSYTVSPGRIEYTVKR